MSQVVLEFSSTDKEKKPTGKNQTGNWKQTNKKGAFIIASLQLLFSNVTGPFVNSFHN